MYAPKINLVWPGLLCDVTSRNAEKRVVFTQRNSRTIVKKQNTAGVRLETLQTRLTSSRREVVLGKILQRQEQTPKRWCKLDQVLNRWPRRLRREEAERVRIMSIRLYARCVRKVTSSGTIPVSSRSITTNRRATREHLEQAATEAVRETFRDQTANAASERSQQVPAQQGIVRSKQHQRTASAIEESRS